MKLFTANRQDNSESGKALLELAMIVPFLVLLAFGTIEALKYVRYEQFLSVVTRETVRASFDCAYNTSGVDLCLENAVNKAFPAAVTGVMQNAAVVVTVWEFTALNTNAAKVGEFIRTPTLVSPANAHYTPATATSHFDAYRVSKLHSYSAEKHRIVIAEAIYSQPPLFGFLGGLINFGSFNGQYYAVTIL